VGVWQVIIVTCVDSSLTTNCQKLSYWDVM